VAKQNDYIAEVDKFIGNKIYLLRLAHGMSRQQLAAVIGVTHQQLQKYEKGSNRISVGRLALIAKALDSTIESFYDGLEHRHAESHATQHQRMCIEVSRNFMKINSSEQQQMVSALVRSLVKSSAE
jgi:transcriptional regulator with XRE-family HTH domain